jgi:hypothetical protein
VNRLAAKSIVEETSMRIACKPVWNVAFVLFVPFLAADLSNAQIVNQVDVDMSHSFMITSKTFPPGKYSFRMSQGSDLQSMSIANADGKTLDQFMVRESIAPKTPTHTELVFNRYGNKEFLRKIYEAGNKTGVAVSETSKEEKELQQQGQKPVEHTETK